MSSHGNKFGLRSVPTRQEGVLEIRVQARGLVTSPLSRAQVLRHRKRRDIVVDDLPRPAELGTSN